MIPLYGYLILSALLFSVGLFGVVARKNAIAILLSVELMLNAANINFIAFWRYFEAAGDPITVNGQVFTAAVFVVAAAEVSVGLALIISVWRQRKTIAADQLDMLKW